MMFISSEYVLADLLLSFGSGSEAFIPASTVRVDDILSTTTVSNNDSDTGKAPSIDS